MRLREIQKKVAEELPKISVNAIHNANTGKNELSNFQSSINAINIIAEFNFIDKELAQLKELDQIYYDKSSGDKILIDNGTLASYKAAIEAISLKCRAVISVADESLPEESQNTIDVKLPNFKSLKETATFFDDLNKALEVAIVNKDIGGRVELNGFESGSLWISIILGTKIAVDFVGQIVSTSLDLKAKFYETEQLRIVTKSLSNAVEAQGMLLKALDDSLKEETQARTAQLLEESPVQDKSPEYLGRLTLSVETITKLIYQGTEIYPALQAPKESKQKFPEFPKTLSSIESKLLKEKANDTEQEAE